MIQRIKRQEVQRTLATSTTRRYVIVFAGPTDSHDIPSLSPLAEEFQHWLTHRHYVPGTDVVCYVTDDDKQSVTFAHNGLTKVTLHDRVSLKRLITAMRLISTDMTDE